MKGGVSFPKKSAFTDCNLDSNEERQCQSPLSLESSFEVPQISSSSNSDSLSLVTLFILGFLFQCAVVVFSMAAFTFTVY